MTNIDHVKKAIVTIVLLLIAAATWTATLDTPAEDLVDAGFKRALVAFASARALNAAISLAQGTEVSLGIGAGVTLSVGEVLDPVNDLVEHFSDFMLMVTIAFGIQKALLLIGQYVYIKVVLMAVIVGWGAVYIAGKNAPGWLNRLLIIMLLARFAIPVVSVGTEAIFKQFLEKDYATALRQIKFATLATKDVSAIQEMHTEQQVDKTQAHQPQSVQVQTGQPQEIKGVYDKMKEVLLQTYKALPSAQDIKDSTNETINAIGTELKDRTTGRIEALSAKIDAAVEHVIKVIVVFLLQTMLIPLVLLWVLFTVAKGMIYASSLSRGST